MKVLEKRESRELCTESGWYAYDLVTDLPVGRPEIEALGSLGALTYLGMLSKPFYRIENEYHMIKGLEGEKLLRVAMLGGREEILEEARRVLEREESERKD